jgi:hypothetical protein
MECRLGQRSKHVEMTVGNVPSESDELRFWIQAKPRAKRRFGEAQEIRRGCRWDLV